MDGMDYDFANPWLLVVVVAGYLLGSIPFGFLLTRFGGFGDIRGIGSGNIGATNVLRTGSKMLAGLTFLGDALKGTAAVLLGGAFAGREGAMLAGLAAFIGHLAPVWLRFRGGKGVSTYVGVALGLFWPVVPVFAVAWIGAAYATKYSSVGGLAASVVTTLALFLFGQPAIGWLFVILTVLLWLRHAENIRRLTVGTEGRIGQNG